MLVVALPLLVLLGLMVGLDYVRLRDDALQAARARLIDAAERHASALEVRMRAVAQPARSMAGFLEADAGLTETELYELLRRNVEGDGLAVGSGVFFQPGAFVRPRGAVAGGGAGVPPSGVAGTRRPRTGEFAPYVQRVGDSARGEGGGEAVRVPRAPREHADLVRSDLAESVDYTGEASRWFSVPRATGRAVWAMVAERAGVVAHAEPFFRGGRFAGVVRVDVSLDGLLAEALRDPGSRGGGDVCVLAAGHELIPVGRWDAGADREALARAMRSGGRGSAWLGAEGLPGGERLAAFAPVVSGEGAAASGGEDPWVVACVEARAEIVRPVLDAVRKRLTDGLVFIGAAVAAVLGFSTWLVRPLRRLARVARAARRRALGAETRAAANEPEETEQRLAREMQASLLPTAFPERGDLTVHALSQPARFVGGDFFDVFPVAGAPAHEPDVAIVIADVAGKGVPAAMLMAVTRTLVRDLASGGAGPSQTLERANRLLLESNPDCLFVSVFLGLYSGLSGEVRYANAGHPAPLVASVKGQTREVGPATGTVLATLPEARFGEGTIALAAGERLVLFTDGVSEARDEAGRFLGPDGVSRLCEKHAALEPRGLCEALCAAARAFQGGTLRDDATVLVLERRVAVRV